MTDHADESARTPDGSVWLDPVGRYESGEFDSDAAEIIAHDHREDDLFVVNAEAGGIEVLDVSAPEDPTASDVITVADAWEGVGETTNVALSEGTLAVSACADPVWETGRVLLYDAATRDHLATVEVGATPDMVKFVDERRLLVACAGEPSPDYESNPRGGVAVVDVPEDRSDASAQFVDFSTFDDGADDLREAGVRLFGPDPRPSRDLEAEYLAVDPDGSTAYVVCQPNNAVASFDVEDRAFTALHPLGFKDHDETGNELDASDVDRVSIRNWPVYGMYQPDAIDAYAVGDETYLVTANEGAMRDTEGFDEVASVADLDLDPEAFDVDAVSGVDGVEDLQRPDHLGNLLVTTERGDLDGDGRHEELYSFGGRSFSIWTSEGELVFDSGADFELLTAMHHPEFFNADGLSNDPFVRSPSKGPEPEGITLGTVDGRTYAFVGLERIGSLVVYDVTDPRRARFVQYVNERDFGVDPGSDIADGPHDASDAGDLGPEGVTFVPGEEAPDGDPLLVVGNELSGTTTVYRVRSTGC